MSYQLNTHGRNFWFEPPYIRCATGTLEAGFVRPVLVMRILTLGYEIMSPRKLYMEALNTESLPGSEVWLWFFVNSFGNHDSGCTFIENLANAITLKVRQSNKRPHTFALSRRTS